MRSHKNIVFLLIAAFILVTATTMATLRGQQQERPSRNDRRAEFESQFPIADYSAPEPTDPEKRAKRQIKGRKYDKSIMSVTPSNSDESTTNTEHWALGLPALPAIQSSAIVIGDVIDAQAYMSDDKTGVYSEFTILLREVLKGDNCAQLTQGNSIVADRPGGRVRFPSGGIGQYWTAGQGMPRVGHLYVLFLTRKDEEENFHILTGYELRAGRVVLLDNPGSGHPITTYRGADEASFLSQVRAAIVNSSQPNSH